MSMVRIPPPERSVFQGNTLSGLLRSGSIVPSVNHTNTPHSTAKYLNGTVHENQPIMHPLQSNADLQPTRSVLEDLKAISRKRINNDVSTIIGINSKAIPEMLYLNQELDAREITKKYKDVDEETAAAAAAAASASSSLPDPHIQSSKRQRDHQSSPHQTGTSSDVSPSEKQAVKKRLYTQNNEISSSLSSGLILLNSKRKNLEQQFRSEEVSQKSKQQRNDDYIELPKLPEGETWSIPEEQETTTKKKDPPVESVNTNVEQPTTEIKAKPKITLFNKNYDDCEVRKVSFDDENAGKIPYIKPKKISAFTSKNFCKEKAQQMKLEMMLKGLKGELDKDDDEVDCPKVPEPAVVASVAPIVTTASTTTASVITAPVSFGDVKSSNALTSTPVSSPLSFGTTAVSSNNKPALSVTTPTTTAPALKVAGEVTKKIEAASLPVATPKQAPTFNFGAPKSSDATTTVTSLPTFGAAVTTSLAAPTSNTIVPLSFGVTSSTASSTPGAGVSSAPTFSTSTTTASAFTKNAAFGTATTTSPPAFGTNITSAPAAAPATTTIAAFSFGSPIATASTLTPTFEAKKASNASSETATPVFGSSTKTAPPSFGNPSTNAAVFGNASTTTAATFGGSTTSAPVFGSSANAPTFGSSKPPTFGSAQTDSQPPNAFGGSLVFGSTAFGPTDSIKTTSEGLSFSSGKSSAVNPPAFGGPSTAATSNNPVFGSATPKTTAQSSFSFGGSATNTTAPSFGAASVFGSPSSNKPAGTSGGFSFSSSNASAALSKPVAFGSTQDIKSSQPAPSSGGFSFGGGNQAQQATPPSSFGANSTFPAQASSKPFAFGGSVDSTASKPGGFSFGGANAAQSPTSSPFNTNATPSFGASKPDSGNNFMFGKTNSEVNKPTNAVSPFGGPSTQSQQPSGFGGSFGGQASANSSAFSFGGSTAPPTQNSSQSGFGQQQSSNIFGNATASSNNGFGANNAASSAPPTNVFGNKPSFGSVSHTNNSSSFAFGSGAANGNNNTGQGSSPAFAFGSNNQPQNQSNSSASNAFQFGSGATATNNANSAFNFSNGGAGNAGAFGVNSQQGNAFAPNPTNNLFNPGPSDQRPIRKATRRMQK